MRFRIPAVVAALSAMAVACIPEAEVDDNETINNLNAGAAQDFSPADGVVPLPNILTLNPTTGRNNFPSQCGESAGAAQLRGGILNTLDGSGTWLPPLTVTFSEEVDLASVEGHVFLYRLSTTPGEAIPTDVRRYQTVRYDDAYPTCGAQNVVEGLTIIPERPLDDNALYTVAITTGVTSAESGETFVSSSTWSLVSGNEPPFDSTDINGDGIVQPTEITANRTPLNPFDTTDANGNGVADVMEQLSGLSQLYAANAQFLPFLDGVLGLPRTDIVIAWAFKTQTEELQLSPTAPRGPSSHVDETPFNSTVVDATTVTGAGVPFVFANAGISCGTGLGQQDCSQVGAVYGYAPNPQDNPNAFDAQNYQTPQQNPGGAGLTGLVAGPWADPIDPPQAGGPNRLKWVGFLPSSAQPAGGYPVVIFGHGLSSSREALIAIAAKLASRGFASIAVDWPQSGSRATQIYPAALCGAPSDPASPTANPACFQPILTANLANTRDNVRQGVVDIHRLVEFLKSCSADPTTCGGFAVDATRIGYMGQSLGSIIGSMPVAMNPDIKSAVLNVPGVSWLSILENTDTNAIKCPLIDALINNGTLTGTTCGLQADGTCANADALCASPVDQPIAVTADPVYQTFAAAARWVLDPADGVNFADRIGARLQAGSLSVLIQQVNGDIVVPNEATRILGALLGFTEPAAANVPAAVGATPTATPVTGQAAVPVAYIEYTNTEVTTYQHASLLLPAGVGTPGVALGATGTSQMQEDAVNFLATHIQ